MVTLNVVDDLFRQVEGRSQGHFFVVMDVLLNRGSVPNDSINRFFLVQILDMHHAFELVLHVVGQDLAKELGFVQVVVECVLDIVELDSMMAMAWQTRKNLFGALFSLKSN